MSDASLHGSALVAVPRVPLTPGMLFAVALHVLVFGGALVLPKYFDRPPPLRKPIIAKLIALGKPRDAKLLPRKESPPPPAPPSRTAPSPVVPLAPPAPASKPSTTAMKAPPAPPKPRAPTRKELMDRALAKVSGHAPRTESREKPDPDRAGQASGSASGTAETAEAGDRYFTEVHDAILANYVVPSVISERERLFLSATVVAWIKADGSLLKHELQKKSGNHFFDEALEIAIQKTRLPPPPPELARSLRDEGVALNFKP